jgi:single-strand DNA-binding protein
MNRVIIIGNVGTNPEVKTFENGGKIANFSVATTEHWKDKTSGEKKERTDWHNVQVSNLAMVGIVEKFVTKGMKVAIDGSIRYNSTGEGESKKFFTKIIAERIEFLNKPNTESSGHVAEEHTDETKFFIEEGTDDLPF